MPKIYFVFPNGVEIPVTVNAGKTLLEAAWDNDIGIEGACEGNLACSTCHILVEEKYLSELPEAIEEEEDLLDLAWGVQGNSRLGCQITITNALDGVRFFLLTKTNNQM